MPARLSASGLARGRACPASYALPAVHRDNADARRGREVHSYLEAVAGGTHPSVAWQAVPEGEARELCAKIDCKQIPRGEPEVGFAFDTATGRARRTAPRAAGYTDLTDTEIPGTADLVVADAVWDWKTTRWDHDLELSRPQLEFYALCHARVAGLESVRYVVAIITDDGAIALQSRRLDWEDLARVAADARHAFERVNAARERIATQPVPDVTEGAHCHWCPSFAYCPAKRAAVGAALGMDLAELVKLTPGDVARAYLRTRDATKVHDQVRELVAEALDQSGGEIETGDGQAIRRDGRGALRVVRAA